MRNISVKQWIFSKWTIIVLGAMSVIPFLYFNCSPVRFATLPEDVPGKVRTDATCDGKPNEFIWTVRDGTLTEPELTRLLGTPRHARRFALAFDRTRTTLPVEIEIRVVEGVKRYTRIGGHHAD